MPLAKRWLRGPEAWLVGSALGYLMSSLAASLLYRFELGTPFTVAATALILGAATVFASRFVAGEPSSLPALGTSYLAATLVLALAVVVVPLSNIGASTPEGTAYRAYFSADLMTHLSVVAELQKGTFPLENPFYRGDVLGYYWLFFTFPASFGAWATNQHALVVTYVASGLLFAGLLFAAGRRLSLTPVRSFLGASVMLTAVSYEGVVALARSERWTDVNVDALSRWVFELVSLDGLHRSLLYTPQHLFSYSLLLVLMLMLARGQPANASSAAFAGVLLGGMAGTSIVTAMLAGPWLVVVLWRRRHDVPFWTTSIVATLSSLLLLGWFVALGFFGDAGGALTLRMPRIGELPSILFLDAGALVVLVLWRRGWRLSLDRELLALAALALGSVLFLDLEGYEGVWMAWRAGSVFLVSIGLVAIRELRPAHGWVLVPALLTATLDVFNAADIDNRRLSPGGFAWTTVVSPDEIRAIDWIRRETSPDAVVQWDVRARSPGEWALVPALAARRMAVGFPIFLLDLQKYRTRERRHVRPIFGGGDAIDAHRRAREQGIDFLVLGSAETRARGSRLEPLFDADELFSTAFESGEVAVLEVLPP